MHFPEWRIGWWWFCLSPSHSHSVVCSSFPSPVHIPRHALVLGIALPGDDNEDGSRGRTCPCQGLSSYQHTVYLYVDVASDSGKGIGIMDFVVVGVLYWDGWEYCPVEWRVCFAKGGQTVTVITQFLMSCIIVL